MQVSVQIAHSLDGPRTTDIVMSSTDRIEIASELRPCFDTSWYQIPRSRVISPVKTMPTVPSYVDAVAVLTASVLVNGTIYNYISVIQLCNLV